MSTETPALFNAAVEEAADFLRRGEIVAVPTETVYGLAANALEAAAVRKIFEAKGRPAHNPLIVHVASAEMARSCVAEWPARAEELARKYWPGPLTLVLPKAAVIPDEVTAGGETVAVRWPSHPFMQAVIRRCGFPLAAPSANWSNEVSPTNAAHVMASLEGRVNLAIDGGQCQVGIESTVFDVVNDRVLRPGMISAKELEAGESSEEKGILRSPGLLKQHYAPRAKLVVAAWSITAQSKLIAAAAGFTVERTWVIAYRSIPMKLGFLGVSVIPEDAEAYARALYAELHRCDEAGAEMILVEMPPSGPEWEGIRDRLRRAAGGQVAGM
ncbi:MAG TPA: L-threonylcarbamoyladenylate synthase [Verrucomicrobiae bacterium]|nr:L-threonylcarbamoyladenylate synthase [Verrucomicrobiae bacterium]